METALPTQNGSECNSAAGSWHLAAGYLAFLKSNKGNGEAHGGIHFN